MNDSMPNVSIVEADLARPDHAVATLDMVDAYSRDPLGDSQPLSVEARATLIEGLRRHPTTVVLLAYSDEKPAGVAVCFLGFSTFAAKPLLNIHDFVVLAEYRGRGIARRLMEAVERKARNLGCCKITLEVLDNNRPALVVYERAGFKQATYNTRGGGALFFTKPLT